MKIICLLLLLGSALFAGAQGAGENVQVKLNKHILVKKFTTGNAAQTITIKPAMLRGKINTLVITQTGFSQAGWKRVFTLLDSNGNEVMTYEKERTAGVFNWPVNELLYLLQQHGSLMLYTTALPTNPAQAALVRVARFHICTLVYK